MRPLRDACPEAAASEASELRQISRVTVERLKDLILGYLDWIVEAPACIATRSIADRLNRRGDSRCSVCNLESPRWRASLNSEQRDCREIICNYLVTKLKPGFSGSETDAGTYAVLRQV
jgi:hypothetical protein